MAEAVVSTKRVCLIGSSHVRNVQNRGHNSGTFPDGTAYELKYFFIPGSCFDDWIGWPEQLYDAAAYEPHYVFFHLGGNSIVDEDSVVAIKGNAKVFIDICKAAFPNAKIIPVQIEARYLEAPHPRFGTPAWPVYRNLRNKINKYLHRNRQKHHLCIIAGPNNLDRPEYYAHDKIHLNNTGTHVFLNIILSTLRFVYHKDAQNN